MHYNNINCGPLVRETFLFLSQKIAQNTDGNLSVPEEKLLKAYSDSFLTYKEFRDYAEVDFNKSDLEQLGNHLSTEMADDEIYEGLLLFDFDVEEEEFDASVGSYSPREFEVTPVAYCLSEWLPSPGSYDYLWFPIRALDYKHSNKSDIESMKDIANDNYQNYLEDRVSI